MSDKGNVLTSGTRNTLLVIVSLAGYGASYRLAAQETACDYWITRHSYSSAELGRLFVPAAWVEASLTGKQVRLSGPRHRGGVNKRKHSFTAEPLNYWHGTEISDQLSLAPKFPYARHEKYRASTGQRLTRRFE
jgi:hypothetical protein